MDILITGATGFFGGIIYKHFPEADTLGRGSMNSIIADITAPIPSIQKKYDLVVHCAALAHKTPLNQFEEDLFYKINHFGTVNLLNSFENLCMPKSFVLISTVAVYGKSSGINISELESLAPDTPYALSKAKAEEETLKWGIKNNIRIAILRLPLVLGCNPPGNLHLMIKGIERNFYFNISTGKVRKSMVLAQDVAEIILTASAIGGIYNLTDGYHPSFRELSEEIALQLDKKRPGSIPKWIALIIAKVGDFLGSKAPFNSAKLLKITSELTFDDSKARKLLGWNPTPVLEGFKIK